MGLLLIIVLLAVGYLMYKNGLIPASLDGADRKVPSRNLWLENYFEKLLRAPQICNSGEQKGGLRL